MIEKKLFFPLTSLSIILIVVGSIGISYNLMDKYECDIDFEEHWLTFGHNINYLEKLGSTKLYIGSGDSFGSDIQLEAEWRDDFHISKFYYNVINYSSLGEEIGCPSLSDRDGNSHVFFINTKEEILLPNDLEYNGVLYEKGTPYLEVHRLRILFYYNDTWWTPKSPIIVEQKDLEVFEDLNLGFKEYPCPIKSHIELFEIFNIITDSTTIIESFIDITP